MKRMLRPQRPRIRATSATMESVTHESSEPVRPTDAGAREAHVLQIEQGITQLYRMTKAAVKSLSERFDPDLQPAGFGILRYIMTAEPIRGGDIAIALGMDKSAVSRQLTALRELGLLETQPDPEDGRASLLVSTDKAKAALTRFQRSFRDDNLRILDSWPNDDVETFARLLGEFNGAASNGPKSPPE